MSTLLGIAVLGVSLALPVEPLRATAPPMPQPRVLASHALPAPEITGSHELAPLEKLGPRLPRSKSVGAPNGGRLKNGEQLPASSEFHFTFDSALRRSPSRGWRRWGTELTLHRTMRVFEEFHAAHPRAARLGVGDISRPHGGAFGRNYGGLGHASHQNGRDVDIYWPRRDRRERPPRSIKQVDLRLAQDLVDRFVDAGAELVFVGPKTGLRGPKDVVHVLVGHDDHVHVRWPSR